jgi:hypothetical protein
LLGGGVLAVLWCCACGGAGVGGYFLWFASPSIAGKWESDGRKWEFHRDGTGKLTARIPNPVGKRDEVTGHFEYKLVQGDPLTLELKILRGEGPVPEGMKREIGQTKTLKVELKGETMTLTELGNRNLGDSLTLKRVP